MAVGEQVTTKFTWLLDDVEVAGVVRLDPKNGDAFDIEPDPEYAYLIALSRGNHPLPWKADGTPPALHLESYVPVADQVNHDDAYPIAGLPSGQSFPVILANGTTRSLAEGDHVRVRGRWVIDHHPEHCQDFGRCHDRGWLRVGQAHMELHPIRWDAIQLVTSPMPGDVVSRVLSLAAPIHEEEYLADGKWLANEAAGVAGKVFLADDMSNFHTSMATTLRLDAPAFPAGWDDVYRELHWDEQLLQVGFDLDANQVRSIAADATGITVAASVTAVSPDPTELPSINFPSLGRSVFQARYRVWWDLVGRRIECIVKPHRADPGEHIDSVGGTLPDGTRWQRRLEDAVALAERGCPFYVQVPGADRVDVHVAVSASGRKYLRTVTDFEAPNNLLALPTCP